MAKKRRVVLIALGIVIAVICLGIVGINIFMRTVKSNLDKLARTEITNVDLSTIADGAYTGKYKVFPIALK